MEQAAVAGLRNVKARLDAAARRQGRAPESVQLVVVSKTFGAEAIRPVLAEGHRVFGENRVQEAMGKWPELRKSYPDVELHLIGPLQSNKAAEAVALFDVIQTVDREKIVSSLLVQMKKQNRFPKLFVQVNTGLEPQKAGIAPQEVTSFVAKILQQPELRLEGLMCIPPVDDDPRPHFQMLRELATACRLDKLSMGMSGDFETAIAEGATHVRVGSAIFGTRG